MSNWITITEATLRATGHGAIIDRALSNVGVSAITKAIRDGRQRVRRAVSTGNALDIDPEKVPASLENEASLLAIGSLCILIGYPMDEDLREAVKAARSETNRVSDGRIKVEAADTPESTPTMQATGRNAEAVNVQPRLTGRERTSGL